MKRTILILALSVVTHIMAAQETRKEVVRTTTPADDSKPNSDTIPKVYAIDTQFERILIIRLKYQTDLLTGIDSIVKQNNIRNAVILSGIGSVRGYHLHMVTNRTFPSKNMFIKNSTAPADLIGMNGYVINGRVHAHMTLANEEKAFGGHLEVGTEVFTFAIVTLGILSNEIDISRIDDKTYR